MEAKLSVREIEALPIRNRISSYACWIAAGLALIALHVAIMWLSIRFDWSRDSLVRPVGAFVALEMIAGLVYLGTLGTLRRSSTPEIPFAWIIVVGALLRVSMFASNPILETDFYRYLWDGAVLSHGVNPYRYSPSQAIQGGNAPEKLRQLAAESGIVTERINHSGLRTIYPPLAQAAFALAYRLAPWSLTAWRLVLLGFDLATLALVILLLRELKLSPLWAAVYWWNPLLIKEAFNAAHMDLLVLPFMLGALFFTIRRRSLPALALLACAAGMKVWPILLLPLVLRPFVRKPLELAAGLAAMIAFLAVLAIPVFLAGDISDSSLSVYAQTWEMNDGFYRLLHMGLRSLLSLFGQAALSQAITRSVIVILLAGWILALARKSFADPSDFCNRCLLAVVALFLLSPTGFPWYYIWLIPLLTLRPRFSLLMLTPLLPLYYLKYYSLHLERGGGPADQSILWLEFAPVWILLIAEWLRARKQQAVGNPA